MKSPLQNLISNTKAAAKRGAIDFKLEASLKGKAFISWQPKRGERKAHMITFPKSEAPAAIQTLTEHIHSLNGRG